MGVWGAGIFSDDVAEDVREEYRQLLGDGVDDADAAERVLAEYAADPDDMVVAVLALAWTQSALGRLDDGLRDRALALIDDGTALAAWQDAPAADVRARRAALARLRAKLTGPQPARKTVRREWRPQTTLVAGDVLAWRDRNGRIRLLRVVTVDDTRNGRWPVLELLAGLWDTVPPADEMNELKAASISRFGGGPSRRPRRWTAYPFHYGEPDWRRAGFTLVGRIAPRPKDDAARSNNDMPWPSVVRELEALGDATGEDTTH